jgi:hypothetical protein
MLRSLVAAVVLGLVSLGAQGALIGRLPSTLGGADYQAYYDTDLNITWLADANYAATEPFGPFGGCYYQGLMCWTDAVGYYGTQPVTSWIGQLNATGYLGINDWRLPRTNQPDPTCSRTQSEGSVGYYCTGSELGHLFYEELGGVAGQVLSQTHNANYLLLPNIQPHYYWTGCPVTGICGVSRAGENVWAYNLSTGSQEVWCVGCGAYVWPVADGDPLAPVPVPPAVLLFGSALGLMGVMLRKVSS